MTANRICIGITDGEISEDISHGHPVFTMARKLREAGIPIAPTIDPHADNPFKVTTGQLRWVYWNFEKAWHFEWVGVEVPA